MKIKLNKEQVDELFEVGTNQGEVLIAIIKMIVPEFDQAKSIGFAKANEKTCFYLSKKFMAFDRKHHPQVMAGGLWMNNGFSIEADLDDWEVIKPSVTL